MSTAGAGIRLKRKVCELRMVHHVRYVKISRFLRAIKEVSRLIGAKHIFISMRLSA